MHEEDAPGQVRMARLVCRQLQRVQEGNSPRDGKSTGAPTAQARSSATLQQRGRCIHKVPFWDCLFQTARLGSSDPLRIRCTLSKSSYRGKESALATSP